MAAVNSHIETSDLLLQRNNLIGRVCIGTRFFCFSTCLAGNPSSQRKKKKTSVQLFTGVLRGTCHLICRGMSAPTQESNKTQRVERLPRRRR